MSDSPNNSLSIIEPLSQIDSTLNVNIKLLQDLSKFNEPQLRAAIKSEKFDLDNCPIFRELAKEDEFAQRQACSSCSKQTELKRCPFCGKYYCKECMYKVRQQPGRKERYLPVCKVCDKMFIRKRLFEKFYDKYLGNEKSIEKLEGIKQEALASLAEVEKDLEIMKKQHKLELEEKGGTGKQLGEKEQELNKKLAEEKNTYDKLVTEEKDNEKLTEELPSKIMAVQSEIEKNNEIQNKLSIENETFKERKMKALESVKQMVADVCKAKKINLSEGLKGIRSEKETISRKEGAKQKADLNSSCACKCSIM